MHPSIRRSARPESIVAQTLAFANELTGEPIILLEEIESAGIDRLRCGE